MSIAASITQAVKYFDLATDIYKRIQTSVMQGAADLDVNTLPEAKEKLEAAMQRATEAHKNLDDAIAARLEEDE